MLTGAYWQECRLTRYSHSQGFLENSIAPKFPTVKRGWLLVAFGALAIVVLLLWWHRGGRDQLVLALQPQFQVIQIDTIKNTMTLHRLNQTYVVNCAMDCQNFSAGKSYSMLDRGGILQFKLNGRMVLLRIVQEHIDFDTVTGGRG